MYTNKEQIKTLAPLIGLIVIQITNLINIHTNTLLVPGNDA